MAGMVWQYRVWQVMFRSGTAGKAG